MHRYLTSFIGRERELAEVNRLLDGASAASRFLTLTGPGGCGKTRLALRAAESRYKSYADGVAVVELAALADPTLAPQFVASALGVGDVPGRPTLTTLVEYLRPQEVLLVLDNCEHVVDTCAVLVEKLLLSCPGLCVLATSREMLGVPGEIAWAVPALTGPGSGYVDVRRSGPGGRCTPRRSGPPLCRSGSPGRLIVRGHGSERGDPGTHLPSFGWHAVAH